MSFKDFKDIQANTVARQFIAGLFKDPDRTIRQLMEELTDPDLDEYLDTPMCKILELQGIQVDRTRKASVKDAAMAYMRTFAESSYEYLSAAEIVEGIGASTPAYINKIFVEGIKAHKLPLMMAHRRHGTVGSPTNVYRYVADWDKE